MVMVYIKSTDEQVWIHESSKNLKPRTKQHGSTPPTEWIWEAEERQYQSSPEDESSSDDDDEPLVSSSKEKTAKSKKNKTKKSKVKAMTAEEKKTKMKALVSREKAKAKERAEAKALAQEKPTLRAPQIPNEEQIMQALNGSALKTMQKMAQLLPKPKPSGQAPHQDQRPRAGSAAGTNVVFCKGCGESLNSRDAHRCKVCRCFLHSYILCDNVVCDTETGVYLCIECSDCMSEPPRKLNINCKSMIHNSLHMLVVYL